MIHLHYTLNSENFKELSSYMALHDQKTTKRLIMLMLSFTIILIMLSLIILHISIFTLIAVIAGLLLIVLFLPKLYWNMIFKRMDHFVDNSNVIYPEVYVRISNDIHICEEGRDFTIDFSDIRKFDYTKNNCIIFYQCEGRTDTLVLPVAAFSEEELREFNKTLVEIVY